MHFELPTDRTFPRWKLGLRQDNSLSLSEEDERSLGSGEFMSNASVVCYEQEVQLLGR